MISDNEKQIIAWWHKQRSVAVVAACYHYVETLKLLKLYYDSHKDVDKPLEVCDEASPFRDDSASSKSKRKRSSLDENIEQRLQESEARLIRLANAIEQGKLIIENVEEEFPPDKIFAELERLQFNPSKIVDAYMLLCFDKAKARIFFEAPDAYRLDVIHKLMSSSEKHNPFFCMNKLGKD
ncbi:uncharacterized protein LOC122013408 [Zingiber officinale]|uniref:uncharacterized protein LOC122013408 n=1 Tax=Zingiber officinale TaxID=94328 RepID=UPI001C4DB8DD|nr:uncharacterized protein LOC122013408 [Zingiber officinale]